VGVAATTNWRGKAGQTAGGGVELLERADELGALRDALTGVARGRGETIAVLGPAGTGKTALLDRFAVDAQTGGCRVLRARGELLEQEFPWGTVRGLFAEIDRAHAGAAELAGIALHGSERQGSSLFASLHGLHWLAVELAQEQPLALLVDDAHWCDALSNRWLGYLAARVADERVLLVIAARPSLRREDEVWPALLSEARVLRLDALAEPAVERLLGALLGRRPSRSVVDLSHRLTKGNPLLVRELANALVAAGVTGDAATMRWLQALPSAAVTPNLAMRLRRLGRCATAVAHAAAVLGRESNPGRIARLTGLTADEVVLGLQRLSDDLLITTRDAVEFVHPLMRSAAYDDLGAPRRSAWHAQAARLLPAEGLDPDVVAAHLLLAAPEGDPAFVALLRNAARHALARTAPRAAARYLARAMQEPPPEAERTEVLLELADAQLADEPEPAARSFQAALDGPTTNEQRIHAHLGLAQSMVRRGRFAAAADLLERELRLHPPRQAAARDRLLAALLNAARWEHGSRRRSGPYADALRRRWATGEPISPELHANLAIDVFAAGVDREAALAHAEAALVNLEVASQQDVMWAPAVMTPLSGSGAPLRAIEINDRIIEFARATGQRLVLSTTLSGNAYIKSRLGRVPEAIADADDALRLAEDPLTTCFAAIFLAEAYMDNDQPGQARDLLAAQELMGALPEWWPYPWLRCTRGWLRFLEGDPESAIEDLQAAGVLMLRFDFHTPAVTGWRGRMAAVWAALGQRERALRVASLELRAARRWGERWSIATALTTAGIYAEPSEGIALLQEAMRCASRATEVVPRVAAMIALGGALRRSGQRRRARELLAEAQALASELGLMAAARQAREELRAAGGRPRRLARRGVDALTPSEIRVAGLAAEGHTNPEIAQRLFVTRRTVETHLTSIYGKLGVDGRGQLAGALSQSQAIG
jgi:DNA-binding CsgD family transcriptional regulator